MTIEQPDNTALNDAELLQILNRRDPEEITKLIEQRNNLRERADQAIATEENLDEL